MIPARTEARFPTLSRRFGVRAGPSSPGLPVDLSRLVREILLEGGQPQIQLGLHENGCCLSPKIFDLPDARHDISFGSFRYNLYLPRRYYGGHDGV